MAERSARRGNRRGCHARFKLTALIRQRAGVHGSATHGRCGMIGAERLRRLACRRRAIHGGRGCQCAPRGTRDGKRQTGCHGNTAKRAAQRRQILRAVYSDQCGLAHREALARPGGITRIRERPRRNAIIGRGAERCG